MNIKNKLKEAYYNNDLNNYQKLIDEYLSYGYGIDYEMIYFLIRLLINNRNFDKAYTIIKTLEKNIDNYNIANELCCLYCWCYKPEDAERIYISKNLDDNLLLIKIYLIQGKIEQAYNTIIKSLNEKISFEQQNKYMKYKFMIDDHLRKGIAIETEYESFIKNGDTLEPGHIVFLKDKTVTSLEILKDSKKNNRPYLIWKIEENDLYMFPVTTKCRDKDNHNKGFTLYSQKYGNNFQDRRLINSLCHTTTDNILSVQDKILEEDYKKILTDIFYSIYFNKNEKIVNNLKFMKEYIGKPNKYDIIEYVDKNTKEHTYYLVLYIEANYYKVVKIDCKNYIIIDNKTRIIDKKQLISKIIKPTPEALQELLPQVSKILKLENLSWRKIKVGNIEYIVINVDDNICHCINAIYSASIILREDIKKEDIDLIGDTILEEEIERIQRILNDPSNRKKQLRKRK